MSRGDARASREPLWRRAVAVVGAVAAIVAGSVTGFAIPAAAVSGSEFDPGFIISDDLFYDAGAMSASDIEAFLVSKGGALAGRTITYGGKPTYVSSRTGKVVCDAISGGTMKVSELIYRAQVACSISAKVVLATIQKEQGLITNPNPSEWGISHAMGMACPDTAPCDPGFAGLGNQLVSGTAQLRCYKICNFAKQPGAQYIQYHPDNARCGGTTIFVQNYATAALYSYTPYQPNSAALANLGGTGDSCSSYGNRNFWAYYNNWFGSTIGNGEGAGAVAINEAWAAQGGKTGPWGNRLRYMDCRNGFECGHVFENVIVGWTFAGGIFSVSGATKTWILAQGVEKVGYPDSNVVPIAGGTQQSFSRGLLNVTPGGTMFMVGGPTRAELGRLGGVATGIGWPTGTKVCTYAGGACLQPFQNAFISEVNGTAYSLTDPTMIAYFRSTGGATSPLGVPDTNPVSVTGPNGNGAQQSFQGGLVAQSAAGIFALRGPVRTAHGAEGGVRASLGWPTAEQVCDATACSQTFQHGLIYATTGGTTRVITGPISSYYAAKGGTAGVLGAPASDIITMTASGGGQQMVFAGGIVESSAAGTFTVTGGVRDAHGRAGGVGGSFGWPTAEEVCTPDGACSQSFQRGSILSAPKGGLSGGISDPAIAAYYQSKGGPTGALGYPVTSTITVAASGGGYQVGFQGGLVESSAAGTFLLSGAIRDAHGRQGGVAGPLGWPTAEQTCTTTGCSQTFQNGTLFSSTKNGLSGGVSNAAIAAYYQAHGGPAGALGYPTTGTVAVAAAGSGYQVGFEGGLVETSASGTFLVTGALRDAHGHAGGVAGKLGWPTAEQVSLPGDVGAWSQTFQNGTLFVGQNGATGWISDPAIMAYYTAHGAVPDTTLGYPQSGTIPVAASGGGVQVAFFGGLVESSPAGTFLVTGPIRDAHGRQGGVAGPLGWPIAEQVCGADGGCSQAFQNGTLFASASGVAGSMTNSAIAAYYTAAGGPGGALGYPLTSTVTIPATANGGGVQVGFQGGLVESSAAGTFLLTGAIREAHGAQGGVAGPLGWPTAEQVCAPDETCSQTFQFGTLTRSNRSR